jgi:hypothetical protein
MNSSRFIKKAKYWYECVFTCAFHCLTAQKEQVPVDHIGKLQEWEDGKERVIKFVSDAYAPENLLKIMGCNSQQLKEQQELRITEGISLSLVNKL